MPSDPSSVDPVDLPSEYLLETLFAALGGEGRGAAIRELKARLGSYLAADNLTAATDFIRTVARVVEARHHGIFKADYLTTVTTFESVTELSDLRELSWLLEFCPLSSALGAQRQTALLGAMYERLYVHADDFQKPIVLEAARRNYYAAGMIADADRMQQAKQAAVQAHPLQTSPGIPLPEEPMRRLWQSFEEKRDAWLGMDDGNKFCSLTIDWFGLRPGVFAPTQPSISDMLAVTGALQTMELHPDGRSSNGAPGNPQRRRWWDVHVVHHSKVLSGFLESFLTWCQEDQPDSTHPAGDIHGFKGWLIPRSLVGHGALSPTTEHLLKQGMAAFLQELWLPCLAVWIPCFERALRERLDGMGVHVFSHQPHPGVEHAALLDSLLAKSEGQFPEETILYWKHWFGQTDGVGNNLRNEHCHGFLEAEQYCGWVGLGTLMAFLFLLDPLPPPSTDGTTASDDLLSEETPV